jgi:predicted transcriptional regulator/transcriptional regulator with XRE-family HTH domain
MAASDKKLFLGGRLKRLRRDLGLTQSRMAEDLAISPSYLNLLERNQRPVTAQILLRLADAYDLDLRALTIDEPGGGASLEEVFADRMFADLKISRHEIAEIGDQSPAFAEALVRLYRGYVDRGRLIDLSAIERSEAEGGGANDSPTDWVRDLVGAQRNHFAEMEACAEVISATAPIDREDLGAALRAQLQEKFGIQTRLMPAEVMGPFLRRYDRHRKRLLLHETLAPASRLFAAAYQLGVLEHGPAIAALADRFNPPDRTSRQLLRLFLGNYLAAAILLPYAPFLAALEATGYDIELVRARFGVSYEQAAQRLTTLTRPEARGIPFFMMRVDAAGNVSKRFASGPFPFSRFGGACPRWSLHDSFKTPGRLIPQIIETPDGQRFFTLSRTVRRASGLWAGQEDELAIGLGCELKYAAKLIYGKSIDLLSASVVEIGPSCRICERIACPRRAAAPINRSLLVDETNKAIAPYPFLA